MAINLNELCPGWIKNNPSFPIDGSDTAIEKAFQTYMKLKQKICDDLQLTNGRIDITTNTKNKEGDFCNSLKIMKLLVPKEYPVSTADIMDNNFNGRKVSKLILSQCTDNADHLHTNSNISSGLIAMIQFAKELKQELPKFVEFSTYITVETIPQFVQNFYSEVAAVKNVKTIFSVNPYDMLNATNSRTFSSCFSVGGMHASHTHKLLSCINAGVISNINEANHVLGRAWVFFNTDYSCYLVKPTYGIGLVTEKIDAAISTLITNTNNHTKPWYLTKGTPLDVKIDKAYYLTMYTDDTNKTYSCSKTITPFTVNSCGTICIKCGDINSYISDDGLCYDCECKLNRCESCGSTIWAGTSKFCLPCSSTHATCNICGCVYDITKQKGCPECSIKTRCFFCGSDKLVGFYGQNLICKNCKDIIKKHICSICGSNSIVIPLHGKGYCINCIPNHINSMSGKKTGGPND